MYSNNIYIYILRNKLFELLKNLISEEEFSITINS